MIRCLIIFLTVIVASAKGKVEVIAKKRDRYSDNDPDPR